VIAPDGVEIVVHDLGGRGEPALLAHATGFHGLVWEPLARHLAASLRCTAFDGRGHGNSGVPPREDFDWSGFGRDVLAVVEGLDLGRPFGVGHSSGSTALLLAEQARPGLFRAIYCFEPVIVPADPPLGRDTESWLAAGARRRREAFASRDEALSSYGSKLPLSGLDPAVLSAYVQHGFEDLDDGTVRLKCRREAEALINEMATAHDCFAQLSQARCPVTLAYGAASEAFNPALVGALRDALPTATTEVMAGLGHLGPLEDPRAVAASVLAAFSPSL